MLRPTLTKNRRKSNRFVNFSFVFIWTNVFVFSYATNGRRITAPTTPKTSWSNSSSSSNCKQISETNENAFLAPPSNVFTTKSQSSELASYLSRRRNTTGSISLNKIVDIKNTSAGNPLKLAAVAAALNNSNQKLSSESKTKTKFSKSIAEKKTFRFSFFFV